MSCLAPTKLDRRTWALVLVAAFLVSAVLLPAPALSHQAGIVGQTRGGCSCHNQTESLSVTPTLEGLPPSYEPGEEYRLTVSYEGGPARGPGARAGFDLAASAGQLVAQEGSVDIRVDPSTGEATHTLEGSNATEWTVLWRAPSEGEGRVTITLLVNAVNGDGVQGPGDQWGRLEVDVPEDEPGGLGRASGFWVVLGLASVLAILALAWYGTRGPKVERG